MRGPWGRRWWGAIGSVIDEQNARMRQAREATTLDGALALGLSDALDRIGADRLLPRGGSAPDVADEADVTYAARLKTAWETWAQSPTTGGGGGSVKGMLVELAVQGFPVEDTGATVVNHNGVWHQLISGELVSTDGAEMVNRQNLLGVPGGMEGFTLDVRDQFYSRFVILFLADVPTLTNDDTAAKARLNGTVKRWKSGSAVYDGAVVIPTGDSIWGWPMGTTWGAWRATWGEGTTTSRFIDPE